MASRKLRDARCNVCEHTFEVFLEDGVTPPLCPLCKADSRIIMGAPKLFTTIIPDYPGAKRQKAGYVMSHGDRPATKIQVQGANFGPSKD